LSAAYDAAVDLIGVTCRGWALSTRAFLTLSSLFINELVTVNMLPRSAVTFDRYLRAPFWVFTDAAVNYPTSEPLSHRTKFFIFTLWSLTH